MRLFTIFPIIGFLFIVSPSLVKAYTKPTPEQCSDAAYKAECLKICDYSKKKIAYINEGGIAAFPGEMERLNSDVANYCPKTTTSSTKTIVSPKPSPIPSLSPSPTASVLPTLTPTIQPPPSPIAQPNEARPKNIFGYIWARLKAFIFGK